MDPDPRPPLPPTAPRPRLGVALGGGSARGYAHIGVLASLERGGLPPDVVVGTSFGAVVGALYCLGHAPARMRADAEAVRRRDLVPHVIDIDPRRGALLRGDRLEAYFDRLVDGRTFDDLGRVFAVVATDLDTGERIVLRDGPLAAALRASTALPLLVAAARRDGRRLVDGGIGAPVPLDTLAGFDVDVALGVGAGVEVRDSGALRLVRRALGGRAGRSARSLLGRVRRPGALRDAARAADLAIGAWCAAPDALGGDSELHVQTRPPISWLRFDRAGAAILAGERAMDGTWPALARALAAVPAGAS